MEKGRELGVVCFLIKASFGLKTSCLGDSGKEGGREGEGRRERGEGEEKRRNFVVLYAAQ